MLDHIFHNESSKVPHDYSTKKESFGDINLMKVQGHKRNSKK
jgi:hypothetical protein